MRIDARLENHQGQPAEVIAVKVRDQHGVDDSRVDAEAGHRHEGCHAAVNEVTAFRGLDQNAALKSCAAGERASGPQKLHTHTIPRRRITHWIGSSRRTSGWTANETR